MAAISCQYNLKAVQPWLCSPADKICLPCWVAATGWIKITSRASFMTRVKTSTAWWPSAMVRVQQQKPLHCLMVTAVLARNKLYLHNSSATGSVAAAPAVLLAAALAHLLPAVLALPCDYTGQ